MRRVTPTSNQPGQDRCGDAFVRHLSKRLSSFQFVWATGPQTLTAVVSAAAAATDTNVVADGDVNGGADADDMPVDGTGPDDTADAECGAERAAVALAVYQMLVLLESIQTTASVAADKIVASNMKNV